MSTQNRKEREKEYRKNAIVDAAEKVFRDKGFDKATIDEIANTAELAKGTIYLYFKSKEEIYGGIILRGLEKIENLYQTELKKADTGLSKFNMIGKVFMHFCAEYGEYLKAMAMYQSPRFTDFVKQKGTITKEIEEKKRKHIEGIIEIIKLGIKDGSIDSSIDPQKTAQITMRTIAMFAVSVDKQVEHECQLASENLLDYYFNLLSRAIQAKK